MTKFIVYGEPIAQGRPKTTIVNGRAIIYDPARSKNYKQLVALVAQEHAPAQLLTGEITLEIKAFLAIPKSISKKRKAAALSGEMRPTSKPDLKNIIAGIEDALEKVIYQNDSQIVGYGNSGKWYGDPPRIEVTILEK